MNYILAKREFPHLAGFALSNVLLAFDFDGTLAAIAARPGAARLRVSTRRLLTSVCACYPCVVASGRALADITRCVRGIPLWGVIGNHGIEPWNRTLRHASRARRWRDALDRPMALHPGVFLEDKRYSLTVHFRRAHDKAAARRAFRIALVRLKGARVFAGKESVNLVPHDAVHKGSALEHARQLVACDTMVYVGDDRTDEDAFAASSPDRLLSIRVGRSRHSSATHYLKRQREIDPLLRALLNLRRSPAAAAKSDTALRA